MFFLKKHFQKNKHDGFINMSYLHNIVSLTESDKIDNRVLEILFGKFICNINTEDKKSIELVDDARLILVQKLITVGNEILSILKQKEYDIYFLKKFLLGQLSYHSIIYNLCCNHCSQYVVIDKSTDSVNNHQNINNHIFYYLKTQFTFHNDPLKLISGLRSYTGFSFFKKIYNPYSLLNAIKTFITSKLIIDLDNIDYWSPLFSSCYCGKFKLYNNIDFDLLYNN